MVQRLTTVSYTTVISDDDHDDDHGDLMKIIKLLVLKI